MNFDLNDRTIFLCVGGSHAYGMAKATSDHDYRGICIPPLSSYIGFIDTFDQAVSPMTYLSYPEGLMMDDPRTPGADPDTVPDMQVMNILKFMRLALQNNPSVLELLFTDESDYIICDPAMKPILDNRQLMLSKQIKSRFCGYARSQLKRIQSHKKWLDNPPKKKPLREDFGLPNAGILSQDQIGAANAIIQREVDEFMIDQTHLPEDIKIELPLALSKMVRAVWSSIYPEDEYPIGEGEKFETTSDALYWGAAKGQQFSDSFLEALAKEKAYRNSKRDWDQYQTWKRQRNEKRAALESKFGFDCYLDDTEFLTDEGWKKYDEIHNSCKLGTLNQESGELEFQFFTERVEKPFSGKIAFLNPRHSNCAVTLNHRMLVSPAHRSEANGFSAAYVSEDSDWSIKAMEDLISGRRSCYHIRVSCTPQSKDFNITDNLLILLGCYVTEGCVAKRLSDGSASVLRFSQKVGGEMEKFGDHLKAEWPNTVREFSFTHNEEHRRDSCEEKIWTVAHRESAKDIEKWCGSGSENKKLPNWVLKLSARQIDLLLDVMIAGDGTTRPHSRVYYTASKQLADDVQSMCVAGGIISQVWGPYPNGKNLPMYQVYIGKRQEVIPAHFKDGGNIKIEEVSNSRIVCFTVPNEVLVTRRKGNIAIQGNTKHASHLVRLLRMSREILETGVVNVKRPDAEELLAIRAGDWSYEKLIAFADKEDEELNETVKASSLPKIPDMKFWDNLVRETILQYNSNK